MESVHGLRLDRAKVNAVWYAVRIRVYDIGGCFVGHDVRAPVVVLVHVVYLRVERTGVVMVGDAVPVNVAVESKLKDVRAPVVVGYAVVVLPLKGALIHVVGDAVVVLIPLLEGLRTRRVRAAVPVEVVVVVLRLVDALVPPVLYPVGVRVRKLVLGQRKGRRVGAAVTILVPVVCLRGVRAVVHAV